MPNTPSIIDNLHALAARLGAVDHALKADVDDLKSIKSTLVAGAAEVARATQQYIDLQAWAATQGYVPTSSNSSSNESTTNTD